MNVVEVELLGVLFASVVLGLVLLFSEIFLAEGSVGINRDLAISSENLILFRENERVDFDHIAVTGHEALVNLGEHVGNLVGLATDTKVGGSLTEGSLVETFGRVNG